MPYYYGSYSPYYSSAYSAYSTQSHLSRQIDTPAAENIRLLATEMMTNEMMADDVDPVLAHADPTLDSLAFGFGL